MASAYPTRPAKSLLTMNNPALVLDVAEVSTGVQVAFGCGYYHVATDPGQGMTFVEMDVGDVLFQGMTSGEQGIASSKQQINVRKAVSSASVPDPTGFGMVIYDASGRLTWLADKKTISVSDFYTFSTKGLAPEFLSGPITIDCSDRWISLQKDSAFLGDYGNGETWLSSIGIRRSSAGQYEARSRPLAPIYSDGTRQSAGWGDVIFLGAI